jgi:Homing endonuclease associated repeat
MSTGKTCSIEDCERPSSRGGLCGMHYKRSRPAPGQQEADLTITCLICGRRLHNLASHLPRVHGIDSHEYLRRNPGAPLVSEHLRLALSDITLDRHGEPHWTRERIVIALKAWTRKNGRQPTADDWRRPRGARNRFDPLWTPGSRPDQSVVQRVFGSWNAAMLAAGLDPRRPSGSRQTHCRRGHAYGPNDWNSNGRHRCRTCRNLTTRRRRALKKRASLTEGKRRDRR